MQIINETGMDTDCTQCLSPTDTCQHTTSEMNWTWGVMDYLDEYTLGLGSTEATGYNTTMTSFLWPLTSSSWCNLIQLYPFFSFYLWLHVSYSTTSQEKCLVCCLEAPLKSYIRSFVHIKWLISEALKVISIEIDMYYRSVQLFVLK